MFAIVKEYRAVCMVLQKPFRTCFWSLHIHCQSHWLPSKLRTMARLQYCVLVWTLVLEIFNLQELAQCISATEPGQRCACKCPRTQTISKHGADCKYRQYFVTYLWLLTIMTSSNGNIFCVTGHLCGDFTGHRWIPAQRPVMFFWSSPEYTAE